MLPVDLKVRSARVTADELRADEPSNWQGRVAAIYANMEHYGGAAAAALEALYEIELALGKNWQRGPSADQQHPSDDFAGPQIPAWIIKALVGTWIAFSRDRAWPTLDLAFELDTGFGGIPGRERRHYRDRRKAYLDQAGRALQADDIKRKHALGDNAARSVVEHATGIDARTLGDNHRRFREALEQELGPPPEPNGQTVRNPIRPSTSSK